MKKMNKKGFTIVELVIVIAVIAILSAVLIPTFSGVIDEANNTAAVANAKAVYSQYQSAAILESGEAEVNAVFQDAEKRFVVIKASQVFEATDKTSVYETAEAACKAAFGEGKYTIATSDVAVDGKTFAGLKVVTVTAE